MSLEVIEEEPVEWPAPLQKLRLIQDEPTAPPAPPRAPPTPRPASTPEQLAMLTALGSLITVRLALLAAVIGAFALAMTVILNPTTPALVALGTFCAIIVPLSWLAQKRVT